MRVFRFVLMAILVCMQGRGVSAQADDWVGCERQLPDTRIRACTRIIEQKSASREDRARALGNRGRAYLSKAGHERLASADFDQASRLVPTNSSDGAVYRGLFELANRQFPAAISTLSEAIRRNPANARAFVARGAANRLKGDADAALADYSEAIRLDPALAVAHHGRGTIFGARKDHDRALGEFDAAIKIDPTYASALRLRGLAKSELGRLDEALADYNAALRLDPYLAVAYNGRGHVYTKKGDRERAHADYEAAVRLDPTLIVALNNRALSSTQRGDRDSAIADFERVLALPATSSSDRERQQLARERMARLRAAPAGPPTSSARHRRVALVIGNRAYRHAATLANPANDARDVAAALRRLGFTSVTELRDVSRDQMATAIKHFGDLSATAEWALLFFAGHGMEVNGMSYLIPVDAALKRDTHVEDETISLSRVMAKVDAASRIGLVILDACRDNPFASRMVRAGGAARSVANGLAPVEPDGNVLVAYAARHGTVAQDGAGKNSPFTEALLSHIEEPGLEISFLFRKVRDTVRAKTDKRQEPFVYGSLGSDPVYFRSVSAR